jgi:transcriptional regulator with XRE-family HTH domain
MARDDHEESPVGEFIRRQRELQELTMRQLADRVGISNPYLSQIERGLRAPSERVLNSIVDQLELSAEALQDYAQRTREHEDGEESAVVRAVRDDPSLTARQRQALLEVYGAFTGHGSRNRRRRREG